MYAISSAGVVHAITRACSQGELSVCSCDPYTRGRHHDQRGDFDWGGCSDNIHYGVRFAKAFVDAKEKRLKDARALMNLHNNRCGRTVSIHGCACAFLCAAGDRVCAHGLNVNVEVLRASGFLPSTPTPGTGAINARELGNAYVQPDA